MRALSTLWFVLAALLAGPAAADDDDSAVEPEAAAAQGPVDPGPGRVLVITMDDVMVNAGTAEYVLDALTHAQSAADVRALVLELDTPGGALDATRDMVKGMLASNVPIIVYVSPAGSRAASAGVFLTMAGHIAAMAPATNIGAAHPVFMAPPTGGKNDESEGEKQDRLTSEAVMLEKVTNDTVAFARNIADTRGRNAEWAESSVRDSVSIGAKEALAEDVVDLIAPSLGELLAEVDGRVVELADGSRRVLRTKGPLERLEMTPRQRALLALGSPNVAFLLLAVGLLGLYIEYQNPGMMVPGIAGATALLLAALGMAYIPVSVGAILLIVLGFALLVAEVYVVSFGALTAGGISALVLGGLFLVERSPEFTVGVDTSIIAAVVTVTVVIALLLGMLIYRGEKQQAQGGQEGMVGQRGRVLRAIPSGAERGQVLAHGERWSAVCDEEIEEGAAVVVESVDGLVLRVRRG